MIVMQSASGKTPDRGYRPYLLLNVAATVDGKIDTVARGGAVISGEADRDRVQRLRAEVDAVMVGPRTLLDEDPRLTVRVPELRAERVARGAPENPAKVGIVRTPGVLGAGSRFLTDGPARVILFSAEAGAAGSGAEVYVVPDARGRVDLVAAMAKLAELGMRRVLVEGGGTLNFELLRLGLVDEVSVYVAPLIFGGATAPTLADGAGNLGIRLQRTSVESQEDGGVLLRYKVESS